MLTDTAATVDGRGPAQAGLWMSVSALAGERGISKQAISKALRRYATAGTPVSTRRDGRELLVNVAEYDRARGEVGDLGRQQAETTKAGGDTTPASPAAATYTVEQARKAGYEAELKRLDLEERLGKLVKVDELAQAAVDCADTLVRAVDQIVAHADEMAAAVAKDGVAGARAALKIMARDLHRRVAAEFAKMSTAPVHPPTDADTASEQ